MNNYDEQTMLNKRNIAALHQGLRTLEGLRQEDSKRVELLMGTVTMQAQSIQKLQQEVAVLRATSMGRGPTGGN